MNGEVLSHAITGLVYSAGGFLLGVAYANLKAEVDDIWAAVRRRERERDE